MRKIRNFSHYGNQGFPNHPNHQIWRHSKKEILKDDLGREFVKMDPVRKKIIEEKK